MLKTQLLLLFIFLPTFAFASHSLEAFAVFEYLFYFALSCILALINIFFCSYNARKKKSSIRIFTIIVLTIQVILMIRCFKGLPFFAAALFLFILIQLYYIVKGSSKTEIKNDEESD